MRRTVIAISLILSCWCALVPVWADGAADPEVFGDSTATPPNVAVPGSGDALAGGTLAGSGMSEHEEALDLSEIAPTGPRLKDIGKVGGLRSNPLYGVGLVVGLAGTGDDSALTQQMTASYLQRQQVQVTPNVLKGKNFAAVTLTAELPPFAQIGDTLDVTVSAMGATKSLEGGVLILSPLKAANGEIYALSQGALTLGAFGVSAGGGGARASAQKNFLTVARMPNGATLERAVTSDLPQGSQLEWVLQDPDFTTAQRAAAALNAAVPGVGAVALDAQRIAMTRPLSWSGSPVDFIATVEQVVVATDMPMRIVINERNGTIVAGADVRIKPVSVSHGNLSVSVTEGFAVSQPNTPFGGGSTAITPGANVDITEDAATTSTVTTVRDLLDAVSSVGGSIRDAVAILQALKAAGAIDAQLVVI